MVLTFFYAPSSVAPANDDTKELEAKAREAAIVVKIARKFHPYARKLTRMGGDPFLNLAKAVKNGMNEEVADEGGILTGIPEDPITGKRTKAFPLCY